MFSDEILTKIFARKEIQRLNLYQQTEIVHAIEEVLEQEENKNADESLSDTANE